MREDKRESNKQLPAIARWIIKNEDIEWFRIKTISSYQGRRRNSENLSGREPLPPESLLRRPHVSLISLAKLQ
jgi:hypothetical protein